MDRWKAFAERLSEFFTAISFGIVYLLLVPAFTLVARVLDPLHLRKSATHKTFWNKRPKRKIDSDFFRRSV